MTRKDYKLIAEGIREEVMYIEFNEKLLRPDIQMSGIRRVVVSLCASLRNDNPRFDSNKFMQACGLCD